MAIIVSILLLVCLACFPASGAEARPLDYALMAGTPARELFTKAGEYQKMNDADTAMAYYLYTIGAPDIDSSEENRLICAKAYTELGKAYFNIGHYSKAFDAFANAIRICEAQGFNALIPHIYNNLGSIYSTWNDREQGLHYFRKAFEMTDSATQPELYRKLLINMIGAECGNNNLKSAEYYYGLLCRIDDSDRMTEYFKLINRGLILMIGERRDEALAQMQKASEYAEASNLEPQYISYTYTTLGDLYADSRPDSALFYYRKALKLNNPAFLKRGILKTLSVLYRKHNPALADEYTRRYLVLTDSLFDENEINRTKGAQFVYEMEKNLKSIKSLSHDKEVAALRIKRQGTTIAIASGVIALILTLAVMLVRRSVKLQRANRILFEHSNAMLRRHEESRKREKSLEREIEELNARMAVCQTAEINEDASETGKAEGGAIGRLQSVDKLSESQKQAIYRKIAEVTENSASVFDVEFSLETLAGIIGVNSKYVSKVINEYYGCNFRTFINEIRVREAQRRLLDTAGYGCYTIKAIAESVGYKSHANFILIFRKHVGITPSQYQKMAAGEEKPELS